MKQLLVIFLQSSVELIHETNTPQQDTQRLMEQARAHTRQLCAQLPYHKIVFVEEVPQSTQEWPVTHFEVYLQKGQTWSERVIYAFQTLFETGDFERICMVWGHFPLLSAEMIHKGFMALETHQVCIGPATDGRYFMIGMSEMTPELFKEKDGASSGLLRATIEELHRIRKTYYLLPFLTPANFELADSQFQYLRDAR
jgi:uncharacterized protein